MLDGTGCQLMLTCISVPTILHDSMEIAFNSVDFLNRESSTKDDETKCLIKGNLLRSQFFLHILWHCHGSLHQGARIVIIITEAPALMTLK